MKAGRRHSLFPFPRVSLAPLEEDESGPYVSDSVSSGISFFSCPSEQVLNPKMHKKYLLGQTGEKMLI